MASFFQKVSKSTGRKTNAAQAFEGAEENSKTFFQRMRESKVAQKAKEMGKAGAAWTATKFKDAGHDFAEAYRGFIDSYQLRQNDKRLAKVDAVSARVMERNQQKFDRLYAQRSAMQNQMNGQSATQDIGDGYVLQSTGNQYSGQQNVMQQGQIPQMNTGNMQAMMMAVMQMAYQYMDENGRQQFSAAMAAQFGSGNVLQNTGNAMQNGQQAQTTVSTSGQQPAQSAQHQADSQSAVKSQKEMKAIYDSISKVRQNMYYAMNPDDMPMPNQIDSAVDDKVAKRNTARTEKNERGMAFTVIRENTHKRQSILEKQGQTAENNDEVKRLQYVDYLVDKKAAAPDDVIAKIAEEQKASGRAYSDEERIAREKALVKEQVDFWKAQDGLADFNKTALEAETKQSVNQRTVQTSGQKPVNRKLSPEASADQAYADSLNAQSGQQAEKGTQLE